MWVGDKTCSVSNNDNCTQFQHPVATFQLKVAKFQPTVATFQHTVATFQPTLASSSRAGAGRTENFVTSS